MIICRIVWGKDHADVFVQVSTFDQEGVIEVANRYDIDGFVCVGTDQPVLTAAVAAERLGKHFYLDVEKAMLFTKKKTMKSFFDFHQIPSINYAFIQKDFLAEEVSHLTFPVVVKPVDSQGQRGVLILDFYRRCFGIDLMRYYPIHATILFLIEEYYENDEVDV